MWVKCVVVFKLKNKQFVNCSLYGNADVFIKIRWTFPSKVGQRITRHSKPALGGVVNFIVVWHKQYSLFVHFRLSSHHQSRTTAECSARNNNKSKNPKYSETEKWRFEWKEKRIWRNFGLFNGGMLHVYLGIFRPRKLKFDVDLRLQIFTYTTETKYIELVGFWK